MNVGGDGSKKALCAAFVGIYYRSTLVTGQSGPGPVSAFQFAGGAGPSKYTRGQVFIFPFVQPR
jgi:hypothetical protein